MPVCHDLALLLTRTPPLPDGTRVRLRLPHSSDRVLLSRLVARLGLELDELEAGRLLRVDPRRETVLCATVWTAHGDELAGYAATGPGGTTVLADESLAPGIGALLEAALHERAAGRRVA